MISTLQIIVIAFAYVCLLFFIAYNSDKNKPREISSTRKALVYSFCLAIYCTSWTFYGAVGSAANSGWGYLPIYLGPILVYTVGWPIFRRFILVGHERNATSISDFIASRFGKSQQVAAIVTLIAIVAIIPYIALQLKAITMSIEIFDAQQKLFSNLHLNSLIVTILLIIFSILFGTRSLDVTEHQYGMMNAIAFESIVKLLAFCSVGLFALFAIFDGPNSLYQAISHAPELKTLWFGEINIENFITQTVLSAVAIFCLPRQFHVSVVEYHQHKDLSYARWMFPIYLLIISIFVIPIAVAGNLHSVAATANADSYILALPLAEKSSLLSAIVFIGGFSAATGMVIVATVALSTMISNDLVLPLYLSRSHAANVKDKLFSKRMLLFRRIAIVCCLLLSYGFYRVFDNSQSLASIGFLSFTAVFQFMPALILGLYWQRATRFGALAGLVGGFLVWLALTWLPSMRGANLNGEIGSIFGLSLLTESVLLSAAVNTLLIVAVSLLTRPTIDEKVQAYSFVRQHKSRAKKKIPRSHQNQVTIKELKSLTAAIVGSERMVSFFEQYDTELSDNDIAEKWLIEKTEAVLSGSIGTPSARAVIVSALREKGQSVDDVISLLDSTSQALRFNRRLIESTIDTISQGISVVDENKNIIAWNNSYERLMDYPKGLLQIGMPIESLIRFNAERGFCGQGNIEELVQKRLAHLDSGLAYRVERERVDGLVLEIVGNPLPQGGYVTTYTDISEYKAVQSALIENEKKTAIYTDNSPAMLAYLDQKMCFKFVNKALAFSLKKSKEEILGTSYQSLVSTQEFNFKLPYLQKAFDNHKQQFEYASVGNESNYYLITYIPDRSRNGEVKGIYTIAQDISNRRKAELALKESNVTLEQRVQMRTDELHSMVNALEVAKAEAEQANHSKSRFLAAASHDLLQPFSAARLYSEMLKNESTLMSEFQANLVEKTEQSLNVAENIIRSLVDISKLDSGTLHPENKLFDLTDTLVSIENQMQALASRNGNDFKVLKRHCQINTDPELLYRILQNLVSNAIKYAPQGKVLVTAQPRQDSVRVSVWDNGIGIREEDQKRIFKEFTQLSDHKAGSKETGLGLGLSISQRLVEILEFKLEMQSIYGRGSVFHLYIPRVPGDSKPADPPLPASANKSSSRSLSPFNELKVLCVDNEPQIIDAMSMMLGRWGCDVRTASAENQIDNILEDKFIPDLLLVDYQLDHDKTGIEFIEKLRSSIGIMVPAIVITADHSKELEAEIQKCGLKVLYKPVKPAVLRATMNSELN